MSIGSDEVETAVYAVITAHAPCDPGLLVEVVFKLGIYVIQNGLPAGYVARGEDVEKAERSSSRPKKW